MSAIDQNAGYAEANGTRFYYETAGTGDPLVLIHASVADRRMWDGQMGALATGHRVVRYDMRGYGNTPAGAGGHSGAQDLHALLAALGIERAILVGCSGGGTAALDFTLEHPEATKALVLVSTTPSGYRFKGEPPGKLLEFMAAYQQQDLERAAELATQIWLDGPHRTADQVSPGIREPVRGMMRDLVTSRAMNVAGEAVPERPAADRLPEIRVPTLIIVGDQDDPSILEAGEELAAGIPGAQQALIPRAAHLANVERPEEFNRIVLGFLSQLS